MFGHIVVTAVTLHTVKLRVWDNAGQPAVATYGPIGYDVTPPQPVPQIEAPVLARASICCASSRSTTPAMLEHGRQWARLPRPGDKMTR